MKADNLRSIIEIVRRSIYATINPAFLEYFNAIILKIEYGKPYKQSQLKNKHLREHPPMVLAEFEGLKPFHWRIDFGHIILNGGFDIIIGNPPYGSKKILSSIEKDYIKNKNKCTDSGDIAEFFIEKAFSLLKNDGFFGFIIPKPLTYITSWHQIRRFLCTKNIKSIIDVSKAFKEVLLEQVIICIKNCKTDNKDVAIGDLSNNHIKILGDISSQNLNEHIFRIYAFGDYEKLFIKMNKGSNLLSNYFNIFAGIGGITPELTRQKKGIPIIKGKSIKRYGFTGDEWYVPPSVVNTNDLKDHAEKRVVCQDIVAHILNPKPHIKLMATICKEKVLTHETIINFSKKGKMDYETLLILLNSKLISWYVYRFIFNLAIRTMHYRPGYADYTPLKCPIDQQTFNNFAQKMLLLNNQINETCIISSGNEKIIKEIAELENQIDQIVFDLYGLNKNEINLIME